MNGKQFLMATLFAVVLLTISFIPISSRQVGSYDPWVDINEDGKIDIRDLVIIAKRFGTYGTPINKTALFLELQARNKTWHFVTSFTLTFEERNSTLFYIQGEKWRIRWEQITTSSWPGFIIWDENGFAIEGVQLNMILGEHHDAKGIHYVYEGKASFKIESIPGPSVNFTIESYH